MIISFKFYVMNFLEIVIDFYLHITSNVSQVFASCSHCTSYSLLNFVHVIVCDFGLANWVWKFLEFMQNVFEAWEFKENCLKILFLGNWVQNKCFWKSFISYSCILFTKYYALKSFCTKLLCFSKKLVFPEFWSIKPVSQSIEIVIKIFGMALCVLINRTYFSISWKSNREFFKKLCSLRVHNYSNFFKTRSLFIRSVQDARFLSFSSKIFARFFSSKVGKTFLPFLLHLFSCFMH